MKVVALNGSPNREGNTFHALKLITDELEKQGIETQTVHVGGSSVKACNACGGCYKNRNEKCVITDDRANDWIQIMKNSDGIVLGSPVHYSSIGATMKAFLDRAFYVAGANGGFFRHKVGAAIVAVRRSGGVTTFDQLNHYLTYSEMFIPTANYWNVIHGKLPGEVLKDEEGVQVMRTLGKNMAWLMKLMEYGKNKVLPPEKENKTYMSFIR